MLRVIRRWLDERRRAVDVDARMQRRRRERLRERGIWLELDEFGVWRMPEPPRERPVPWAEHAFDFVRWLLLVLGMPLVFGRSTDTLAGALVLALAWVLVCAVRYEQIVAWLRALVLAVELRRRAG